MLVVGGVKYDRRQIMPEIRYAQRTLISLSDMPKREVG